MAGIAVSILTAMAVHSFGAHQLPGFDGSCLIDSAWRPYSGQVPNKDFPCTLPVGFVLGSKWAFQLLGVKWMSLVDFGGIFGVLTFVWSLVLAAGLFESRWPALVLCAAFQCITTVIVSFWWYNTFTTLAGVIYILSAAFWASRPQSKAALLSYGAALIMEALAKPNTAGPLIIFTTLALVLSKEHRLKLIYISAVAFAVWFSILAINGISAFKTLAIYIGVAHRASSVWAIWRFASTATIAWSIVGIAVVLVPLPFLAYSLITNKKILSPTSIIAAGAMLAGIAAFISNGESKLVDLPFTILGIVLFSLQAPALKIWEHYLSYVCIGLAVFAVQWGARRDRVRSDCPYKFHEPYDAGDRHVVGDGFFQGLHCGDIFAETYNEVAAVLAQNPTNTVAFGPRMGWCYAAFNKPSPKGLPIYWEPGTAFPTADTDKLFHHLLESKFDLFILIKDDTTYYTQDQVNSILSMYDVDDSRRILTVLKLKKGMP